MNYKVSTYDSEGTIVEYSGTAADYIVQMGDDEPQLVYATSPLGAFQAAGYEVLSVLSLSYFE